jgi:ribosomal protein S6
MSENEIINNDEVRLYELGINLVTTLEDKIKSDFEEIKNIIKNHGGELKTESTPVAIPLAYTMFKNVDSKNIKHNAASFGWVKFESTPDKIDLIKEELDLNDNLLRYIILKTTEEAQTSAESIAEILSKKGDNDDKKKKRDESEEEVLDTVEDDLDVVVEEEIDEAIEALVEDSKE